MTSSWNYISFVRDQDLLELHGRAHEDQMYAISKYPKRSRQNVSKTEGLLVNVFVDDRVAQIWG